MPYCEYIKTTTGWAIDLNKTYHDEKYVQVTGRR